ncbi:phage tail protein [Chloroflexota bacterium]
MNIVKRKKWSIITGLAIVIILIMTSLSGVVTASPNTNTDSVGEVTYLIEISGISASNMIMLQMPVSSVRIIEFQDGDDPILRKRPGRTSCTNMILASDPNNPTLNAIWDWYGNVKNGQYDRRSISVLMIDSHREEITRYNAMGTWPAEWRVVGLEEQGNNTSVVVEIEFVVEELYRRP